MDVVRRLIAGRHFKLLNIVRIDAKHIVDRRRIRRLIRLDTIDCDVAGLRPQMNTLVPS